MGNPRANLKRWLSEYKGLSDDQLAAYAATYAATPTYFATLDKALKETKNSDELAPLCHQLYSFYRSGRDQLAQFVVELVPTLITVYLSSMADYQSRTSGRSEVLQSCLLALYNLFVSEDQERETFSGDFRVPGIGYSSVFHDGITRPEVKEAMSELVTSQPDFSLLDTVTENNRFLFLYGLVYRYTSQLPSLSQASQESFCRMCQRLVSLDVRPRVQLRADFLVEVICGVYQVLFLHESPSAVEALFAVERRAEFELMHEPLLIVNAIQNSLDSNPSGRPDDGPIGISLATTRAIRHPSVSAITNASFKTEKLPEDIPIQQIIAQGGVTSGGERGGLGTLPEMDDSSLDPDKIEIIVPRQESSGKLQLNKRGMRLKQRGGGDKISTPPLSSGRSAAGASLEVNGNNTGPTTSSTPAGGFVTLKKSSVVRSSLEESDCDEGGPNVPPQTRGVISTSSKL